MHKRGAPGHHLCNAVLLAKKISRSLNAVTAQVVHGTAAGQFNIPKCALCGPLCDSRERTQRTFPRAPLSIICRAFTTAGAKTSVSA